VPRTGSENRFGPTVLIQPALAKTRIRLLIIALEIKIVLNQGSPNECVIPDAVSAHPGVEQRQGEEKKQE
jgi:hypothetical protein